MSIEAYEKWAEREIEILINRGKQFHIENPETEQIHRNTLSVFKSMLDLYRDNLQNLYLFGNELNKLIHHKPLSVITEDEDWMKCTTKDNETIFISERYFGLYKIEKLLSDGTIQTVYHDGNHRFNLINTFNKELSFFYEGAIIRILDEMFPISMPYCIDYNRLENSSINVYLTSFLYKPNNTSMECGWYTLALNYAIIDANHVSINRYFKEDKNGQDEHPCQLIEISFEEYNYRLQNRDK